MFQENSFTKAFNCRVHTAQKLKSSFGDFFGGVSFENFFIAILYLQKSSTQTMKLLTVKSGTKYVFKVNKHDFKTSKTNIRSATENLPRSAQRQASLFCFFAHVEQFQTLS